MAELENIIESFMSSPESLGKIMDVVKLFGGDEKKSGGGKEPEKPLPALSLPEATGIDGDMISKIMELIRDYNASDDRRIKLLGAIRPYLKTGDGVHIDRAIQIVKLSHVARSVLKGFIR